MSFIEISNLTKTYQKGPNVITPLADLSLTVPQGEFLALMGPSGSGKTTLLNIVAGIDSPTAGALTIDGNNIAQLSRAALTKWRAHHVGYIFQLYHLIPILSAFENIELPLLLTSLSKQERRDRIMSALDVVGLADRAHHRPAELSGGQEQRVAIARAIVHDPGLLVADEPTGDLDRESADSILELLNDLCATQKKTIVMVTHDPKAAQATHRTLHLEKGQLVSQSGPSDGTINDQKAV